MVTKHRHAWRTTAFWTLTLPDCDGYYDAFIAWECKHGPTRRLCRRCIEEELVTEEKAREEGVKKGHG